jgi:hypothetical protein
MSQKKVSLSSLSGGRRYFYEVAHYHSFSLPAFPLHPCR